MYSRPDSKALQGLGPKPYLMRAHSRTAAECIHWLRETLHREPVSVCSQAAGLTSSGNSMLSCSALRRFLAALASWESPSSTSCIKGRNKMLSQDASAGCVGSDVFGVHPNKTPSEPKVLTSYVSSVILFDPKLPACLLGSCQAALLTNHQKMNTCLTPCRPPPSALTSMSSVSSSSSMLPPASLASSMLCPCCWGRATSSSSESEERSSGPAASVIQAAW